MLILAAGPPCGTSTPSGPVWWLWLVTILIALAYLSLLGVADGYRPGLRTARRVTARLLQGLGLAALSAGEVLNLLSLHRDRCGHVSGGVKDAAVLLLVAGLVAIMGGSFLRAGAEWLAFAAVGLMDLWLLAVLAASPTPHRLVVVVILATHAAATWQATWWSRRIRAAGRATRAKVSEAGWLLTAGWLTIALLGIASVGQRAGLLLPDSTVIQVLVVASVLLALGPGRTKYIEAVEDLGDSRPLPDRLTLLRRTLTGTVPLRRRLRPVHRTHLAVIEPPAPGPMTVIARGSAESCTAALEEWVHQHGLSDGARSWIVRTVAETAPRPGGGVRTIPVTLPRVRERWLPRWLPVRRASGGGRPQRRR